MPLLQQAVLVPHLGRAPARRAGAGGARWPRRQAGRVRTRRRSSGRRCAGGGVRRSAGRPTAAPSAASGPARSARPPGLCGPRRRCDPTGGRGTRPARTRPSGWRRGPRATRCPQRPHVPVEERPGQAEVRVDEVEPEEGAGHLAGAARVVGGAIVQGRVRARGRRPVLAGVALAVEPVEPVVQRHEGDLTQVEPGDRLLGRDPIRRGVARDVGRSAHRLLSTA